MPLRFGSLLIGLRQGCHCQGSEVWARDKLSLSLHNFIGPVDINAVLLRQERHEMAERASAEPACLFTSAWVCRGAKLHLPGRSTLHYMNQKDICQCVIYFPRSLLNFETDKSDPMPHNDNCNEAFGDIVTWFFPGNTAAFMISRYIPRRNTLSSLG